MQWNLRINNTLNYYYSVSFFLWYHFGYLDELSTIRMKYRNLRKLAHGLKNQLDNQQGQRFNELAQKHSALITRPEICQLDSIDRAERKDGHFVRSCLKTVYKSDLTVLKYKSVGGRSYTDRVTLERSENASLSPVKWNVISELFRFRFKVIVLKIKLNVFVICVFVSLLIFTWHAKNKQSNYVHTLIYNWIFSSYI